MSAPATRLLGRLGHRNRAGSKKGQRAELFLFFVFFYAFPNTKKIQKIKFYRIQGVSLGIGPKTFLVTFKVIKVI